MSTLQILSLVLGVIFLLASGIILLVVKPTNPTALWLIRVVVSLGGGFLAAGLLGFIEIGGKVLDIVIEAGGGFAVFLVLYLLNPPKSFK